MIGAQTNNKDKVIEKHIMWTVRLCKVEYEVFLQIESILMLTPTINPQLAFYKRWS